MSSSSDGIDSSSTTMPNRCEGGSDASSASCPVGKKVASVSALAPLTDKMGALLADKMQDLVSTYGLEACRQALDALQRSKKGEEKVDKEEEVSASIEDLTDTSDSLRPSRKKSLSPPRGEPRRFSHDDLFPFDQLKHPVWVFELETNTIIKKTINGVQNGATEYSSLNTKSDRLPVTKTSRRSTL